MNKATIKLSVNLNKIALLRNSRGEDQPNLIEIAKLVLAHGGDGITVHPRSDGRHILASDVYDLADFCNEHACELNIEGNPLAVANADYPGFLNIVEKARPAQCTLVPDNATQLTSNCGWDLNVHSDILAKMVAKLGSFNLRISVFMDVENYDQFKQLALMGVHRVELYTQNYAKSFSHAYQLVSTPSTAVSESRGKTRGEASENAGIEQFEKVFKKYHFAASQAVAAGLAVNAGHGLNQYNIAKLCTLPGLCELSIGHAIVCEALLDGLPNTLAAYKKNIDSSIAF